MNIEKILWYEQPANIWNEALPLGNGKLGAMVFGGTVRERIQLNEDSLWSGNYIDRNNPNSVENLNKIRTLLAQNEPEKAELLAKYALTGTPDSQRQYQTLGDLFIEMPYIGNNAENYIRLLDLYKAISYTSFSVNNTIYNKEIFISETFNTIVIRISCKATDGESNKISFHANMGRCHFMDEVKTRNNDTVMYSGSGGGLSFTCMMKGTVKGGTVRTVGEYLIVDGADEAVLYLTAATTFRHESPEKYCVETLENAVNSGYQSILDKHLNDAGEHFNRSVLSLHGDSITTTIPTDKRLELYKKERFDNGLIALYYNYGRYLLNSCSRPGSLPANLQGIWCDSIDPAWGSKYTININTEMNYWPAEICNLSECHLPLFEHLKRMYPNGKETAKKMYGAGGWVAHHNTDLWGDTAPQDKWVPSTYWVMGAAWLCTHIWQHYEYTSDKKFLQDYFYLIKEACEFFFDYLTENNKGKLIINPTISPENTYILKNGKHARLAAGCAMDSQILTHLFESAVKACGILGGQQEFCGKLTDMLAKIPPVKIGGDGRILEWMDEYGEAEPGHRHISHLYALFPGNAISVKKTPKLAEAARKTLEHRLKNGGGHTGWSRAWIVNFWAFLRDSKKAQENIELLLSNSTLPNLLDNHPPFQIDGNFGGIAGIANCIMQSDFEEVVIFPSLPECYLRGKITGLRAKGGLTFNIEWNPDSVSAEVIAAFDYKGTVTFKNNVIDIILKANEKTVLKLGNKIKD